MPNRDIVVLGASAGGLQALRTVLSRLRRDFPACLIVAQHQSPRGPAQLVPLLQSACALPVSWVESEQPASRGHVFVAPPDRHVVVQRGHLVPARGARENWARPAINPLFRTAAAEFGSRVIGVLLTGMLHDGVAGLLAIRRCGGLAVVQDPDDAEFSDMPLQAIRAMDVDHVASLSEMGGLLERLVHESAPPTVVPDAICREAALSFPSASKPQRVEQVGEQVPMACPECGGPLWRTGDPAAPTFRCHTGHAFSTRSLLQGQNEEIERSLWVAVRALEERKNLLERLAAEARDRRLWEHVEEFEARAYEDQRHLDHVRALIMNAGEPSASSGLGEVRVPASSQAGQ